MLDKANHSILLKNTWVFACVVVTRLRVYSVKTQSQPKRLSIFTLNNREENKVDY